MPYLMRHSTGSGRQKEEEEQQQQQQNIKSRDTVKTN
jgi:hypothetical protein